MGRILIYKNQDENSSMKANAETFKTVCIIGAGPAGSLSAYLLQKAGFSVTMIDKNSQTKRKVCGEYLCPLGVELIHKLEISEVLEGFEPVYGMKIVSPYGSSFLSFFPKIKNIDYGMSLNRQSFDERLRNLANKSGCKIHLGESLTGIEQKEQQWTIKTSHREETFDLVIAADGIHSRIAHLLGHKAKGDTRRIALHAYLKPKDGATIPRLGQMHIFKDSSYIGIDPIHQEEINFSIVCSSKKLQEKNKVDLINSYIEASTQLREVFNPLSTDTKISSAGYLKSKNNFIAGKGLAYVGDSAGFIDPLTGEGIYNALKGAQLLTQSLQKNPNNTGLKEYKKIKIKYFREKNILNNFFQQLIKRPLLCEFIARFLQKKQNRANAFIGIIGNIYKPIEGLKKILKN